MNKFDFNTHPWMDEEILKGTEFYDSNQQLMFQFLDYLSGLIS